MIGVTARWPGMSELRDKVRRLPAAAQGPVLLSALKAGAQPMSDEKAARCRRKAPLPAMADALGVVKVESTQHSAKVAITNRRGFNSHWYHVLFWEWGTSRMPGEPFMRPVWDSRAATVMGDILKALWEKCVKAA